MSMVESMIPLDANTPPELAAYMAQSRGLMLLVKQASGQMILCSRKLPGWQRWIVAIKNRTKEVV
jgi:hypothetical protein